MASVDFQLPYKNLSWNTEEYVFQETSYNATMNISSPIQNLSAESNVTVKYYPAILAMKRMLGILELIVFVLGAPTNAFVLFLAYHILRTPKSPGRTKHNQWFVATMASCDFLFCVVHAPMMAYMFLQYPHTYTSCLIMYICTHASTTGSSLSLLMLNVDKFLRLYKPLHYPSMMTRQRILACSLSIWLLSAGWAIFLFFGPFMENKFAVSKVAFNGECRQTFSKKKTNIIAYWCFAMLFFVVPTLVSMIISVFTFLVAVRTRNGTSLLSVEAKKREAAEKAKRNRRYAPGDRKQPEADLGKSIHKHSDIKAKKRSPLVGFLKLFGFVFTTTLWTLVTTVPYRLAFLTHGYRTPTEQEVLRGLRLFGVLIFNAVGNAFITLATKKQYSDRIRKIYRCAIGSKEASLRSNTYCKRSSGDTKGTFV